MGRKRTTIRKRITQQTLDATQQWRNNNGIRVKPKYDPDNETIIIEIKASAPNDHLRGDYLLGQFMSKLS